MRSLLNNRYRVPRRSFSNLTSLRCTEWSFRYPVSVIHQGAHSRTIFSYYYYYHWEYDNNELLATYVNHETSYHWECNLAVNESYVLPKAFSSFNVNDCKIWSSSLYILSLRVESSASAAAFCSFKLQTFIKYKVWGIGPSTSMVMIRNLLPPRKFGSWS